MCVIHPLSNSGIIYTCRMCNQLQQLRMQVCAWFLCICYISFVTEVCDTCIHTDINIIIIPYLSSILKTSVPCWFTFDPLWSPWISHLWCLGSRVHNIKRVNSCWDGFRFCCVSSFPSVFPSFWSSPIMTSSSNHSSVLSCSTCPLTFLDFLKCLLFLL